MRIFILLMATISVGITSYPVYAKPSLWTLKKVEEGLIKVGMAHGIQENCDTILPNRFRGLLFVNGIYQYAVDKGYKPSEVRNFFRSEEERAVLREKVIKILDEKGINYKAENALCEFGHDQIKNRTQIGVMIRKK